MLRLQTVFLISNVLRTVKILQGSPKEFVKRYHYHFFSTKPSLSFVCQSCGHDTHKWSGKCSSCGEFNTMKEFKPVSSLSGGSSRSARNISPSDVSKGAWLLPQSSSKGSVSRLSSLMTSSSSINVEGVIDDCRRRSFGSSELDRLFGGSGLLVGSTTLIAGSPGVGKSTLLLQIAALLCRASVLDLDKIKSRSKYSMLFCNSSLQNNAQSVPKIDEPESSVIYVSGEEAVGQLRDRAFRLKIDAPGLFILNESRVEGILAELDSLSSPPSAVIVDSAQTLFTDASPSAAGSVSQVKESALRLIQWAKATNVPVLISGHVTKSGDVAGPRTLEHMVDTVLFMEAEEAVSGGLLGSSGGVDSSSSSSSLSSAFFHSHRLIRCIKNRFGSSNEIGLFEMTHHGFIESLASKLFLSNAMPGSDETQVRPSGCAVAVTTEGSRAICVEVQALSVQQAGPYPRHRATGISSERLYTIAVVLSKHTKTKYNVDLLASVVGGLKIGGDPASDLAIAAAIMSTTLNRPTPAGSCFLGEIGLGGEIRAVARLGDRLKAALQLGFSIAYIPDTGKALPIDFLGDGIRLVKIRNVKDLVSIFNRSEEENYCRNDEKVEEDIRDTTFLKAKFSPNYEKEEEDFLDTAAIQAKFSPEVDLDISDLSKLSPMDLMEQAEALSLRMEGLTRTRSAEVKKEIVSESPPKDWEKSMREFEESRGPAGLDSSEDPIER